MNLIRDTKLAQRCDFLLCLLNMISVRMTAVVCWLYLITFIFVGVTNCMTCPAGSNTNGVVTRSQHSYSGYGNIGVIAAKLGPVSGDHYLFHSTNIANTIVRRVGQDGTVHWNKGYSGLTASQKSCQISRGENYLYIINKNPTFGVARIITSSGLISSSIQV